MVLRPPGGERPRLPRPPARRALLAQAVAALLELAEVRDLVEVAPRGLDELLRRVEDRTGLEALIGAARLSLEEHARALDAGWRWCARHGIAMADDLLGGGLDLRADAAVWEECLTALRLSSPVLTNRIRRELMARRARLVDANAPRPAPPRADAAHPGKRKARARVAGQCCLQ